MGDEQAKQALAAWEALALAALEEGESPAVPCPADLLPAHIHDKVAGRLAEAGSAWKIRSLFEQAGWELSYPPGFEVPHPTYVRYDGPGIAASDHPQRGTFEFACPRCQSDARVKILFSEWGVNLRSGDARGRFRARCTPCRHDFSGHFED